MRVCLSLYRRGCAPVPRVPTVLAKSSDKELDMRKSEVDGITVAQVIQELGVKELRLVGGIVHKCRCT